MYSRIAAHVEFYRKMRPIFEKARIISPSVHENEIRSTERRGITTQSRCCKITARRPFLKCRFAVCAFLTLTILPV